ncbi:hypothetical protein BJF78_05020 [Pseudonocardia sp. CNS-139]|nr:hypothetical protein BJF78_05020 [Pseudonocardia sp. CNS-139]
MWAAIATGPGASAWFVPHEVEGRVGGSVRQDFGGGATTNGQVTAWEPGRRFAYGAFEPPQEGQPDFAFEFLVEGRDGGGTVLRFVQSGFLDRDGWEDEFHGYETGWDLFFGNLRSYLTHFAGQPAQGVVSMAFTAQPTAQAWSLLHKALGLAGPPEPGTTVTLTPDGPPPVEGVVDLVTPAFLGVRSAHGLHRIGAEGGDSGCGVSAYHYLYGGAVDVGGLTAQWQGWLSALFPAPQD